MTTRYVLITLLLLAALFAMTVGCVMIGSSNVTFEQVWRLLLTHAPQGPRDAIVWEIRFPRVLLGLAVGAGLATTGAVLQAMVRNPLADPHLLGTSAGASCGAALAILFGWGAGMGLQGMAFLGALTATILVYALARTRYGIPAARLVLAGVAIGYVLQALTSFVIFASGNLEGSRSVLFWILGSLSLAQWGPSLGVTVVVAALTVIVMTSLSRQIDILSLGDNTAHNLGLNSGVFRALLLIAVSVCIGVFVSQSGAIGFVGLAVPHLARRLVEVRYRRVIPTSALLGAILLLGADLVSRMLLSPREIPIGVVTAFVGSPVLITAIRNMD